MRGRYAALISQLYAASKSRNLHIVLSGDGQVENLDRDVALEILTAWMFQQPRSPHEVVSVAATAAAAPVESVRPNVGALSFLFKNELRQALSSHLASFDLSVRAVLLFIVGVATDTPHAPSQDDLVVLINLDEAQNLSANLLKHVIELILSPLLQNGIRVFLSVSGLNSEQICRGINSTGARILEIVLPLLSMKDMSGILLHLFDMSITNSISAILFWLGGVPRFLELFLQFAARKARADTIIDLESWLAKVATARDLIDCVRMCATETYSSLCRMSPSSMPSDVLGNLFSLSLSGCNVSLEMLVSKAFPQWTLRHCQNNQLLYFKPTAGASGAVIMPPLVLYTVQVATGSNHLGPANSALQVPAILMTPDECEKLTISAVMHRLRAAKLCDSNTIMLSELLGGCPLGGVKDVCLRIPGCFNIVTLDHKIESHNIERFCSNVRRAILAEPTRTAVAFLNGRQASYADSFIVFAELMLLFQEKQSIIARMQAACGRAVPAVSAEGVVAELEKVVHGTPAPFVLLFVSDEAPIVAPSRRFQALILRSVIVITREQHDKLLGVVIANLRRSALSDSSARESGDRVAAAASTSASLSQRRGAVCNVM